MADSLLFVVAAPLEARAVLRGLEFPASASDSPGSWPLLRSIEGFDLLETGVGKAAAAAATARVLDPQRHRAVISLGIGGALPATADGQKLLEIGSAVLAEASVFADEGSAVPDGFLSIQDMGFPPPNGSVRIDADPQLTAALAPAFEIRAAVATVSACSGTDAAARAVAERTGARVEAMEGAAAGMVAALLNVPFVEIRVVSNTTGDRGSQVWELERSIAALSDVAARVRDRLTR